MKIIISRSAQRDLDELSDEIALRISQKIYKLTIGPFGLGSQKLKSGEGYRIRIGDYRVVYQIDQENKLIKVVKVAHRRDVYK